MVVNPDQYHSWIGALVEGRYKVLEIIGRGPGVKGALWVAARVPEGCISASANMSRIGAFPMDDPDNWLYAKDVVDFAVDKGFYDADSGQPFSWRSAYHPNPSASSKRACATRIWMNGPWN